MAKRARPSLTDFAAEATQAAAPEEQRDNIVMLETPAVTPPVTARKTAAHTSLYLSPQVKFAIAEIALHFGKKPHDLYLEGIELMLTKYGRPTIAELEKKK